MIVWSVKLDYNPDSGRMSARVTKTPMDRVLCGLGELRHGWDFQVDGPYWQVFIEMDRRKRDEALEMLLKEARGFIEKMQKSFESIRRVGDVD